MELSHGLAGVSSASQPVCEHSSIRSPLSQTQQRIQPKGAWIHTQPSQKEQSLVAGDILVYLILSKVNIRTSDSHKQ